ncbi:hypothetical protein AHiyo4_10280 [Arthrobacter sp. Hiyo4]|nr:hypothetical protein AHiyo4_10280 [Arthrobacter sp. Hiyo4]
MTVDENEAQVLDQWTQRLAQALQILDLDVDQELLLDLARKSAGSVIHAAAPVTTFLVGYAAGLAAGNGSAGSKEKSTAAVTQAADVAFRLCEDGHDGGPAAGAGRTPVSREPQAQPPATGSSRTITSFDAGVWLPSATLSSGTSTLASG